MARALSLIAGLTLAAHRAVMADADAQAVYPSLAVESDGYAILGITFADARVGGPATIHDYGSLEDEAWDWAPRAPIFAGALGELSQTIPSGLWIRQVAIAISPTLIWVSLRDCVVLE